MRYWIGSLIALSLLAEPAAAETKITVSYGPGNPWMLAYVAKDQGIFAAHGLDVTMQFIAVGSNQPAALMSNSIQVAALSPTIVLFADEGGADIEVVAGASGQGKGRATGGMVAREGSGIKVPADYRGKKIAVPGINSVAQVALMEWLKVNGVDPKSAAYIEVPINRMNDMLKGSQIDAALLGVPYYDQVIQAKTGYAAGDPFGDLANPFTIYNAWGMRREYMAAHPEVLPAFRASIKEAVEWIAKNDTEARKTQITYLKLPEAVAMSVKLPDFSTTVTPAQMQWWIDTCKSLGITKGTATLAEVYRK